MIRHIVMWKVNGGIDNPAGREVAEKIKNDLESLIDQLDCIERIEVHLNDKDASPANHDVVLDSEFRSYEMMQQYAQSPEHVAVAEYLKQHTTGRTAIDYLVS